MKNIYQFPFIFILIVITQITNAQEFYNFPDFLEKDKDFEVKINGKTVDMFQSRAAKFLLFQIEGQTKIEITAPGNIRDVDIRPKKLNIQTKIQNKKLTFTINRPVKLSVEINKNIVQPVFIFANAPEQVPSKQEIDHFFEAGKIHEISTLKLKNNEKVYVEGGAVVRGKIIAQDARNIAIAGYGLLDGSTLDKQKAGFIQINKCENVVVKDLTLFNGGAGNLTFISSSDIDVTGVNIVNWRINNDGIDFWGCNSVHVKNCFIRGKDNCIGIKSGFKYYMIDSTNLPSQNILVENCAFWNVEWGNGVAIGPETATPVISNITFRNCDFMHVHSGGVMSINSAQASVSNISFENLRVEDARQNLIVLQLPDYRNRPLGSGGIKNIYFKNVEVTGGMFPYSIIEGNSEVQQVENILFENLKILGQIIQNPAEGHFFTKYFRNVLFDF